MMLQKLTADLGKDAFEKLSDQEKALFKLFIWVGYRCHKNLNTVLGGYIALSKFWKENGLEPPILLPNKFNATVINDAIHTGDNDTASTATHQAIQKSSRGAIKAIKLAGDILNNKNDKFTSGGRRKLALILPFQTHLIHNSNLTVWHQQH